MFGARSTLGRLARVVGTAEIQAIRAIGFDVIAVPTNNFPNHGRVIHPCGVAGFTPENLQKLATVFVNKGRLVVMASMKCVIVDSRRHRVAEIEVQTVEDEWYYGRLVCDALPEGLRRDLEWYDEVVSDQMLSYLDDAFAAVERHQLSVCLPDETCSRAYSLHIGKSGEAVFRIIPVPPPDQNRIDVSAMLS